MRFQKLAGRARLGAGERGDWEALLRYYGFASEDEALAWKGNPLDQVETIVREGIPLVHVYGDADEMVPWDENTGAMIERVAALGGSMQACLKPGALHHPMGPRTRQSWRIG